MNSLLDPSHLITTFGLLGVAAILFAETGILIGFFLPGDSLLFIAGLMTGGNNPIAPLWLLLIVTVVAAFAGDQVGYQIGKSAGPAVLRSKAGRMIGEVRINKARDYFDKYGARTVIIARFIPVVRTVVLCLQASTKCPELPLSAGISSAQLPGVRCYPSPATFWAKSALFATTWTSSFLESLQFR